MQMNQITLPCEDYEASVRFYRKLGLRQIVSNPPHYARFETPTGQTLSIQRFDSPTPEHDVVVYFEVEDVDATATRLGERGLRFESEPTDQSWLWREAHLRDPAGNRLCIYHAGDNRRFPPWRLRDPAAEPSK